MISEPLNSAGHQNYPPGTEHGYAATISGDVGSFHHNLIAHAQGRSWSLGSQLGDDGNFRGKLDLRNSVVYNFGSRVTDGSQSRVNFVNNYYEKGPASTINYALKASYELPAAGTETYHCAGNVMPGVFSASSAQYSGDGTGVTDKIKFYNTPFFESYVATQSAEEAFKRVLSDSGVSQPAQDDHDKPIVRETKDGTTTYTGSITRKKGIIDDPKDVGGLESFPTATRPSSWDTNNDGIADWWDGSTGGTGWTPIEGYINFMTEPHSFVSPSKSVSINLGALAAGFKNPTFTVSGSTKGTATVSGSSATYKAGGSAGIDYINVSIRDSEGNTWVIKYGIVIYAGAN